MPGTSRPGGRASAASSRHALPPRSGCTTIALAGWEERAVGHENAELARLAGQPERGTVLIPGHRTDIFGGTLAGWQALLTVAAQVIREVARRILADVTGKVTCATEAARLNREGVPSPSGRRAQLYARPVKGHHWTHTTVKHILTSEAALGYLMHDGRPVVGPDGKPTRIAPPLWDRPTRDALIAKTAPKRKGSAAPKVGQLLSGIAWCGCWGARLYLSGRRAERDAYGCTGQVRGIQASAACRPAPSIGVAELDDQVSAWFLSSYGAGEVMKRVWDAGTGQARTATRELRVKSGDGTAMRKHYAVQGQLMPMSLSISAISPEAPVKNSVPMPSARAPGRLCSVSSTNRQSLGGKPSLPAVSRKICGSGLRRPTWSEMTTASNSPSRSHPAYGS